MSFNFSELQQAYLRNLETIDAVIEMLRKLPGTGYQQVQYYDKNGNLVTKNIPNIGQLIQEFQQGVNSTMAKAIYVDAENGSDETGDGSPSAPFKTIKKAVDSVPVGGKITVVLVGSDSYEQPKIYEIDEDIVLTNKYVFLRTNGSGKFTKIVPKVIKASYGYLTAKGFRLYKSSIRIVSNRYSGYVFLENPKKTEDADWDWRHKALIQVADGMCSVSIIGLYSEYPNITMTDEGSNIICINSRDDAAPFCNINLWALKIRIENTNCKVIDFYQGMSHTSGAVDGCCLDIKDANDNSITFKDIISGIVYDSNTGLPKNILTATF